MNFRHDYMNRQECNSIDYSGTRNKYKAPVVVPDGRYTTNLDDGMLYRKDILQRAVLFVLCILLGLLCLQLFFVG